MTPIGDIRKKYRNPVRAQFPEQQRIDDHPRYAETVKKPTDIVIPSNGAGPWLPDRTRP